MKKFRGARDFAQWRISSWDVLVANSDSSIPAGPLAQSFFRALLSPDVPDPRVLSLILDGSQGILPLGLPLPLMLTNKVLRCIAR